MIQYRLETVEVQYRNVSCVWLSFFYSSDKWTLFLSRFKLQGVKMPKAVGASSPLWFWPVSPSNRKLGKWGPNSFQLHPWHCHSSLLWSNVGQMVSVAGCFLCIHIGVRQLGSEPVLLTFPPGPLLPGCGASSAFSWWGGAPGLGICKPHPCSQTVGRCTEAGLPLPLKPRGGERGWAGRSSGNWTQFTDIWYQHIFPLVGSYANAAPSVEARAVRNSSSAGTVPAA